ncbi:MAG: DUF4214 domain-containing protein [Oscillospiraceae bacterium]|jgi:N-acetylmuramoyl-L-alanine amidase|nr:DUF4214 domain-containing protein [Oscillospiraceae bacterium]
MRFKKLIVFLLIIAIFTSICGGIFSINATESEDDYIDFPSEYEDEGPPETETNDVNAASSDGFTVASTGVLAGRVIFLDPGHGPATSPGSGNYVEHVRMYHLATEIKSRLEALGAKVHNTRYNGINHNITLQSRSAWVNRTTLENIRDMPNNTHTSAQISEINELIGIMDRVYQNPETDARTYLNYPFSASRVIHPSLQRVFEYQNHPLIRNNYMLISLHSNATASGSDGGVRGAEAYYISPSEFLNTRTYWPNYSFSTESRNLGDIILNHIHNVSLNGQNIPRRGNGLRPENLFIIREINIPAVLVENGFHTNATDRSLLMNDTYISMLADAYVSSIISYFDALPLFFIPRPVPPPQLFTKNVSFNGTPISGATVHINGQTLVTNANGDVSIMLPGESNHSYIVQAGNVYFREHGSVYIGLTDTAASVSLTRIDTTQIGQFVMRLYDTALGRRHDDVGLHSWANSLRSGGGTGASVAHGFFFSNEFKQRNLTNEAFVDTLYSVMLNRKPDENGRAHWLSLLNSWTPREVVFAGFANSAEFNRISSEYNISAGSFTASVNSNTFYQPSRAEVEPFVRRLYTEALLRDPDSYGLDTWVTRLINGATGTSIAHGFVFSVEMNNKNLTDEGFVEMLYRALLGRKYDSYGRTSWITRLENGMTREEVFYGFTSSPEFGQICTKHWIRR